MAEKVGGLLIELSANVARLQKDMNDAVGHVKRASDQMSSAASFARGALESIGAGMSIRAFVGFIRNTADAADELLKMSQKTGIAVESLSALEYAGKLSDVTIEQLGIGLKSLSTNIDEGDDSFKRLGISLKNADGSAKTTEQILGEVADKFSVMEDGAGKSAIAVKLFGKSGIDLIPMLNQGKAGLKDMADEAKRLGAIISTETAQASEQFNDNLTRLEVRLLTVGKALANPIISNLGSFINNVLAAQKVTDDWFLAITRSLVPAAERIVDITDRLEKLRAKRAELEKSGRGKPIRFIGDELQSTKNTITKLEEELKVYYAILNETRKLEDRPEPVRKGKAPAMLDKGAAARAKKELDDAKHLANEIAQFNQQVDDAQEDAVKARMKQLDDLADAEKDAARDQLELAREIAAFNKEVDEAQEVSMKAHQKQADELAKTIDAATKSMIEAIEGFGRTTSRVMAQAIVDGRLTSETLKAVFRNFFMEVIEQQLYHNLFGPVFNALGGSITSGIGGLFGGGATPASQLAGGLIPLAGGTNYVPQDMPALLHKGEAVVPKEYNQGGAGNITVNQFINVDSRSDMQSVYAAMKMAKAQTMAEIQRSKQRNGAFAR